MPMQVINLLSTIIVVKQCRSINLGYKFDEKKPISKLMKKTILKTISSLLIKGPRITKVVRLFIVCTAKQGSARIVKSNNEPN